MKTAATKRLLILGALLLPLAGTARAAGDARDTGRVGKEAGTTTPKLSFRDQRFVTRAGMANLAEVKLGLLALQKSTDPEVRQLAQKMVSDHQSSYDRLRDLASKENMPVPNTVESREQAEYERLSKMEGRQFDSAYLNHTIQAHELAVSMFQTASNELDNDELRDYANTNLPKLKEHRQHAVSRERDISKEKGELRK